MSDSYPGDPDVDYTADPPAPVDPVGQAVAGEVLNSDGSAPPPLKPGIQSTEFWMTLATTVVSLLVGLGVVGPDFAKAHEQLVNAACMLAAIVAPGLYAIGRGIAKHGHQRAVGDVLAAHVPLPPLP